MVALKKLLLLYALFLSLPVLAAGAINPDVTQNNIHQTICVKGYTKTIRPPSTYTTKLKIKQLHAMGLKGSASDYEEDHLIPLELGGHPTDPANLWPEPWDDAKKKDKLENKLHKKVCKGEMTLLEAQDFFSNWKIN